MTDWDHRELCPDGACTGVIGDDGRCRVCGHVAPNWGDERRRGLVASAADATAEPEASPSPAPSEASGSDGDGDADYEWSRRQLCTNDTCTGVIGENGHCKTCGAPA